MPEAKDMQEAVSEINQWRKVTDWRVAEIERQRKEDVRQMNLLENEVAQVDKKVSRIEGGIEFLKWIVPISITLATAIGTAIAWVVVRTVG